MQNRDFCRENRPDRLKSQELSSFFGHLPRAGRQNRVQNRDFRKLTQRPVFAHRAIMSPRTRQGPVA